MTRCIAMVLVLGMAARGGLGQDAADIKAEMKKLEGQWVRIAVDIEGVKTEDGPKDADKAIRLIIRGDIYDGDRFKIDPSKSPKHIDVITMEDGNETPMRGIYELKGDVLKLCFTYPFEGNLANLGKRPTTFTTKQGDDHVVEIYKRQAK